MTSIMTKPGRFLLSITLVCLLTIVSSGVASGRKPTIALAPAAWHAPIHYFKYTEELRRAGHDIVTHRLPSCNSTHPETQSVAVDAAFIRQTLLMPAINAGKEVVLITHSYSGGPGGVAAKGLTVTERRAAGKAGGIIGLIYISAFIAKEGQTLLDGSGGQFSPWVIEYVSLTIEYSYRD